MAGIARACVVAPARRGEGGQGRAAADFADGLLAAGVDVQYVGPPGPSASTRVASTRVARRVLGSAPRRRAEARAVRRSVPETGWDLVYAMAGTVPVEHRRGIQVIHQTTHHPALEWAALRSAERQTGGWGDLSRPERDRREYEIERADLIHVTTQAVRDEFLEAGVPPARIVHSYLGVDLERFAPGDKSGELRVAFVGPLSMRKGVDVVAELAAWLDGEATVQTVGGPTCPWSRRVVERARFEPQRSVTEMLAASHLLVLPSRSDAFAYVVLEALASGTVPIVTPEVGAAEIVRRLDPRLVIRRQDFAEGTRGLLPDLDLDDLSARAIALAGEFDRRRTSVAAATAVLERSRQLRE